MKYHFITGNMVDNGLMHWTQGKYSIKIFEYQNYFFIEYTILLIHYIFCRVH